MIDCPNGEMRDQLPDFVHEQLPAAARVAVAAHVATCAACASEVALLRELRGAMRAGPKIDVARIVAALPAASRPADRWAAGRVAQRRRFDWRVAAAIVALAAGGGAAAVLSGGRRGPDGPLPIAGNTSAVQQIATTVSIDADLGEASAVELQALLEDLEDFDGLPAGEPEPPAATPGDDAEEGL